MTRDVSEMVRQIDKVFPGNEGGINVILRKHVENQRNLH